MENAIALSSRKQLQILVESFYDHLPFPHFST